MTARAGPRNKAVGASQPVAGRDSDLGPCPETATLEETGVWSCLRWHRVSWVPVLGPVPGPVPDWSQDRSWDWSRVLADCKQSEAVPPVPGPVPGPVLGLVPGPVPGPVLRIHFFVLCPPGTIIDANHFQLHPTPVPSAGGWDGRQRVGGLLLLLFLLFTFFFNRGPRSKWK